MRLRGNRQPGTLAARLVIGAALLALGAGSWVLGTAESSASRVTRGNVPINAGASRPLDISAHNSPTVAANPIIPAQLAVVGRIDSPQKSCALHLSFDGGETWQDSPIPSPVGEPAPVRCFSPDLVFAADGMLHLSFVTLGVANTPNALWVTSSVITDGGTQLSTPVRVSGPLAFQARITADPIRSGSLYLSWVQATEVAELGFATVGNPVLVSRSDDSGASWGDPVRVSQPSRQRVLAPALAMGVDGEVLVAYLDVQEDRLDYHGEHKGQGGPNYSGTWSLVLARSADRGASWRDSVVESHVVPTGRTIAFTPPSPSLAVDRQRGRVYVGFHEGHLGASDVWVWVSNDAGITFGRPRRVNDTPREDGTAQYLPALAVAPDGRLDVVYFDRRSDPTNVFNEVSLQSSSDAGQTFTRRLRLSDRRFDSRIGFGSERGLADLGSRLGLVSTQQAALVAWADTRAGTQASNKQDIAFAVAAFADGSPLRTPLRSTGLALAGLGAVALGSWPLGGLRRRRGTE